MASRLSFLQYSKGYKPFPSSSEGGAYAGLLKWYRKLYVPETFDLLVQLGASN